MLKIKIDYISSNTQKYDSFNNNNSLNFFTTVNLFLGNPRLSLGQNLPRKERLMPKGDLKGAHLFSNDLSRLGHLLFPVITDTDRAYVTILPYKERHRILYASVYLITLHTQISRKTCPSKHNKFTGRMLHFFLIEEGNLTASSLSFIRKMISLLLP